MKTLINLIVFLSLVSFTIFSCTKDDKNIEIIDSTANLDTSNYYFSNYVELDLRFSYTSPIVEDVIWYWDTQGVLQSLEVQYRVNFDLSDQQFKQYQTNTNELYSRIINFNGDTITDDSLFVDDGTHLVSNHIYITQEAATNVLNIYTHYVIPSFTFDLYIYNDEGTSEIPGAMYSYSDQNPLPPPQSYIPLVSFNNVDNPLIATINSSDYENSFVLYGQLLYSGQQTSNCQISDDLSTIEGDYSGKVKVTYRLHYIDTKYSYSKVWDVVNYADIENGELLMTKID